MVPVLILPAGEVNLPFMVNFSTLYRFNNTVAHDS
jgi:hypothetical protein